MILNEKFETFDARITTQSLFEIVASLIYLSIQGLIDLRIILSTKSTKYFLEKKRNNLKSIDLTKSIEYLRPLTASF
jgi:hypothetical protein